jgi:hypothetical protein
MRRKRDAHTDRFDDVTQRLRAERPEASPLELDRIKTSAMSRAKVVRGGGGFGARRLAVSALTVGLLAAGTGGVIAGVGAVHHSGNAAIAQYGDECTGSNPNSFACTPPAKGGGGVLGSKTGKGKTSKRHVKIHLSIPRGSKLTKVTVRVNGKVFFVLTGSKVSANIKLTNLPCGKDTTKIVVTAVTSSGRTITQSYRYHLC